MLGDHRNNSSDSRVIGTIREDAIIGKALFSYWPLSEVGLAPNHSVSFASVESPEQRGRGRPAAAAPGGRRPRRPLPATSGRHSPLYVEKFRLLEHPPYTERLCRLIADHFRPQGVQLVAAPTTGGIILSYEVARAAGRTRHLRRERGRGTALRPRLSPGPGERTLVVDDVLTTGGSIREVIDAVRREGGEPIGRRRAGGPQWRSRGLRPALLRLRGPGPAHLPAGRLPPLRASGDPHRHVEAALRNGLACRP